MSTVALEAGASRVPTLTISVGDETTAATLTLVPPAGDDIPVTPTVVGDDPTSWEAPAYETSAGEWLERWTVTGTGAGKKTITVSVAPDPADQLSGLRVYATTADYAKALRAAPPLGSRRALAEASKLVDEMLLTAIYPVDADGLPTETVHIAALRDATCAQAEWAREEGDTNQVGATKPSSFTLGKLSVQRPAAGATGARRGGRGPHGEWAPRAWARLQQAGLTGYGPQTW